MTKYTSFTLFVGLFLTTVLLLSACSPKYNWREVHGKDASFTVLLPDKPASLSRQITLGGEAITMNMTAAEVDGINFAVGYVQLADGGQVAAVLKSMQMALVKNINGTITHEQAQLPQPAAGAEQTSTVDLEAVGTRVTGNGSEPLLLIGHFAAKGRRVYQVIVLGNEKAVPRDEVNTFLSSFKPD